MNMICLKAAHRTQVARFYAVRVWRVRPAVGLPGFYFLEAEVEKS